VRVFENRVLRIFGPKEEVVGGSRKLHNEELHKLFASPNIIQVIKEGVKGRACSTHGKDEKCIQNLFRKPEKKI